jgi:hypothetical protein
MKRQYFGQEENCQGGIVLGEYIEHDCNKNVRQQGHFMGLN